MKNICFDNWNLTVRLAFDAKHPYSLDVLVTKGSLWTPGLCKYLQDCGVECVSLETIDGFCRVIEQWDQSL